MPKEKKPEKVYEEVNEEDFKGYITEIVDQLHVQAASRDNVTEIINEMAGKWNVKKPLIRKAAAIVFKRNQEETEEQNDEVMQLVNMVL